MFSTSPYTYKSELYTGTPTQPNDIYFFTKSGKDNRTFLAHNARTWTNYGGYIFLVSCFVGLARVINAIKVISVNLFNTIKHQQSSNSGDTWTAFKNLFRGLVEFIPGTLVVLFTFDSVRSYVQLEKIKAEFAEQENVVGIAIDGKVIYTSTFSKIDQAYKKHFHMHTNVLDKNRLYFFQHFCIKLLSKAAAKDSNATIEQIYSKLDLMLDDMSK